MKEYTLKESMAIHASRQIRNGEKVIVGTGMPLVAAIVAKWCHAKDAIVLMEAGPYDSNPSALPSCVADPRGFIGAPWVADPVQMMGMILQQGRIDLGFLGGAQVDKYGNLNSTCLGEYRNANVRLPGSGGASDIGALAKRNLIIISHEFRRLVEKVDYLTTPGWKVHAYKDGKKLKDGLVDRRDIGLAGGPECVVTTMGVMKFDEHTKEMYVSEYYADLGVTLEKIKENTGFAIDTSRACPVKPPTTDELYVLRNIADPEKIFMD
ncbi:MAG: CoA-transferase subunit beta [Desulfocucumaceae bacterium]